MKPPSLEDWRTRGAALTGRVRELPWQRGDWYLEGERLARAAHDPLAQLNQLQTAVLVRRLGEFLADDVEWKTRQNCAAVCRAFPPSRRREGLSFRHHETLAALPVRTQDKWLARCAKEELSVADLRQHIREKLRPASIAPARLYVLEAEVQRMVRWLKAQDLGRDPARRAALRAALEPLVQFHQQLAA